VRSRASRQIPCSEHIISTPIGGPAKAIDLDQATRYATRRLVHCLLPIDSPVPDIKWYLDLIERSPPKVMDAGRVDTFGVLSPRDQLPDQKVRERINKPLETVCGFGRSITNTILAWPPA
jgi:hypothetical protein